MADSSACRNKSPATIRVYTDSLTTFLAWCAREDREAVLARDTVRAFTASLVDSGAASATCSVRHRALHRFGAWLAEEGEIEYNPLAGMVPPKRERVIVPKLSDDELATGPDVRAHRWPVSLGESALERLVVPPRRRAGVFRPHYQDQSISD